MTAKLGSNPSYVWRSILESQELLKSGLACRVGNGQAAFITQEPWLPCEDDPYIHTIHAALEGNKVCSIMTVDQASWDIDLIKDIFCERDANLILSIPIQQTDNDTWYWRKEKLGHYSVKSAYATFRDRVTHTSSSNNSGFWKKIWNLKIPLKVKHFIWRAAKDCLPTKECLIKRRVEVDTLCPVCNMDEETIFHSIVMCPVSVLCWQQLGQVLDSSAVTNLKDWVDEILKHSSRNIIYKIFMVAWSIWKNRNDIVWQQRGQEYVEIVASALQVLNNWESAQDKTFDSSIGFVTQSDGDVHWRKPQVGIVKVNTDAALFENSNSYSYAMVMRDHEGTMVEARSNCKQGLIHPELAEAIGIREALSWIKNKEWTSVIVESDCLTAIQSIRCSSVNLSYFGRVIDDCKNLLADLKARNVSLKFVKRSANMVAHFLARCSSSIADRNWDMGNVHPDLVHVLTNDLKS